MKSTTYSPASNLFISSLLLFMVLCLITLYHLPSQQHGEVLKLLPSHQPIIHHPFWTKTVDKPSIKDRVESWYADWINTTDIQSLFRTRNQTISARCDKIKNRLYEFKIEDAYAFKKLKKKIIKQPARIITGPNLKYCASGKTGTTFTIGVLSSLNASLNVEKSGANDNHVTTFMTVRNPWHRLVSFYLQKTESGYFKSHLVCPPLAKQHKVRRQTRPTFPQIIRCILDYWKRGYADVHWYPAITRCEICTSHYDYIVRTENLSNELRHILMTTQVPGDVIENALGVRRNAVHQARKTSFQNYWNFVREEDIRALQEVYKDELFLLGYPKTPFTDSPYA